MALFDSESGLPLRQHVRFPHIRAAGIASSYTQLDRLIRDHGFPAGILVSPNIRIWPVDEIELWLAGRPTERKATPPRKRKIGCGR